MDIDALEVSQAAAYCVWAMVSSGAPLYLEEST
jgi:hypothetical protein